MTIRSGGGLEAAALRRSAGVGLTWVLTRVDRWTGSSHPKNILPGDE
jgi:hypothetical protein